MQKRTKSRLVNLTFVVVCTGIALSFLYLFWKDLNSFTVRTDKTQIATISFKRNVAQRKFSDRVVWERLQQDTPLYDMDTLRIAQAAEAKIIFTNNAVLNIDENTMLQISSNKDGSININVNGGNIVVDTTDVSENQLPLKLSLNDGSVVAVESGSKISASKDESSGENTLQLQAGNAVVGEAKLEAGQAVQVKEDGKIQKKSVSVTSVGSELNLLKFDESETKDVTLKWTTSAEYEDKPVRIETSYDKDFAKIEKSYEAKGADSVVIENPQGKLYWRVYTEDGKESGSSGKIQVKTVKNVTPMAPVGRATIEYKNELPKIKFAWTGNEYAEYYKLEVFDAADQSKPVLTEEVKAEDYTASSLEKGDYVWKVTPYYAVNEIGYGKSSEVLPLNVVQNAVVSVPKLSVPAENAKISMINGSSAISFAWKSDIKNADYNLIISDKEDFSNTVYEIKTDNTRHIHDFDSSVLGEGQYYWKVSSRFAEDEKFEESAARSFSIAKYESGVNKLLYPPENYSVEQNQLKTVDFAWKLSDEYKVGYDSVVQISKTADFASLVVEEKTQDKSITNLNLEPGKYFWRVAAVDKDDKIIENYSSVEKFTVLKELLPPVVTSDDKFVVSKANVVKISWKPESGADYYKVKLYDSEGKEIKQKKNTTDGTSFNLELSEVVKENWSKYKVSIQSVSEASENSSMRLSREKEFEISAKYPQNLTLVYPAQNQKLNGLDALRTPVKFRWDENDTSAAKSEFVLRKMNPNGTAQIVSRIENPKKEISVPNLGPGSYSWTIDAQSSKGIPISPEKVSYFTITEIPELTLPVLSVPEQNLVMGPAYLKKNRTIVFEWNEVSGATDYVFTLYQKGNRGELRKITEEKTSRTQFKFKNLKNLDIGSFEWQVTAYAHGKKGVEEQKSKTAVNTFKIDFGLPAKVKTLDPGIQYGE
ncbi:MAG: hypothetical protein KBT11_10705 [Treponema sp.]|nr:hypothetical protein [Candidatus Treponema equifaecale]